MAGSRGPWPPSFFPHGNLATPRQGDRANTAAVPTRSHDFVDVAAGAELAVQEFRIRELAETGNREAVDELVQLASEVGDLAELRRLSALGYSDATDLLSEEDESATD